MTAEGFVLRAAQCDPSSDRVAFANQRVTILVEIRKHLAQFDEALSHSLVPDNVIGRRIEVRHIIAVVVALDQLLLA